MGSAAAVQGPSEYAEHLVFANTVESLFVRGLAGQVSAPTLARLKQVGLDLSRPLLPGYTEQAFVDSVAVVAADCYPAISSPEAYRRLGERTVLGMQETVLGRASIGLQRIIGPMRSLLLMPKSMRGGSTFTRATVRQIGPTSMECDITGYALPYGEFQLGAMGAVLTILNITGGHGEILEFAPPLQYLSVRVSW